MKPKKESVTIKEDELIRPGRESEDKPSPYGRGASKHQGSPTDEPKSGQTHIKSEEEQDWPPSGIKPKV